jgi:hypothetical protein
MSTRLGVDARVRIVRGGLLPAPWKPGATGTVLEIVEGEGGPWRRTVYFVEFDRPQIDEEGDGPYLGSEISGRYLRPLA